MSYRVDKEETTQDILPVPRHDATEALKAVKAGKANEVDIAALILAENIDMAGSEEWTKDEDKRLIRKVDLRLIPIVCPSTRRTTRCITDALIAFRLCDIVGP
jgi:hypothetical protein